MMILILQKKAKYMLTTYEPVTIAHDDIDASS